MDGFPTWSLPESSILRKLHRQSKKHSGAYVASKPFEQWAPANVGKTLPATENRALLRQREKEFAKNPTKVFESIQCFWMAHAIAGRDIMPHSVQAHVAVLSRLHSEYDLEYVVEYERYLHAEILESISDRVPVDFNTALGTVKDATVQRITAQRFRNLGDRLKDPDRLKRQSGGRREEDSTLQPSQRPRRKPRIVKLRCACRTISLNRNAAPTHTMGNVCWFIWTRASPMKLRGLLRPRGLSSRGKQSSRADAEGASPPPRLAAAVGAGHQRLAA